MLRKTGKKLKRTSPKIQKLLAFSWKISATGKNLKNVSSPKQKMFCHGSIVEKIYTVLTGKDSTCYLESAKQTLHDMTASNIKNSIYLLVSIPNSSSPLSIWASCFKLIRGFRFTTFEKTQMPISYTGNHQRFDSLRSFVSHSLFVWPFFSNVVKSVFHLRICIFFATNCFQRSSEK